jgi:acyl-CoA thioesterase
MKITEIPDSFSPPLHKALHIKMGVGDGGEGIAWVSVDPDVHYGNRWAHGGLAATLADISSGIAIARAFPIEEAYHSIEGTIELKINFLRKVTEGDMRATARVLHLGRRVAVTEVVIENGDRLVAKAIATFMLSRSADA